MDSDLSRIETQVRSIFHPAYGDVLLADPRARAKFRAAAESGRFISDKDGRALILYGLDRREGKSAREIVTANRAGLDRFLRVLALERESPYAGLIKPPSGVGGSPGPGFQLGFISPNEGRAVFTHMTAPGALAEASLAHLIRMRIIVAAHPQLAPGADDRLVKRLRTYFTHATYPRGRFWTELIRLCGLIAEPDGSVPLRIRTASRDIRKKIPSLSQADARKSVEEALAVFGFRATEGNALNIALSLSERWVTARLSRQKTTTRAVQKRYPYTRSSDYLRFQTYTVYVDEKYTVFENVSLRLPIMTVVLSVAGETTLYVFRGRDSANAKPISGPVPNRKVVDAMSERDCLRYGVLCFRELTTRRLTPLYTNYELDRRALRALPTRP